MLLITPCVARHSFSLCSLTSGGNPAILISLMPIPASSMHTCDISPLSCMYSSCPCESCRTSFTRSSFVNFMYTRLLGPSTWIFHTSASTSRNLSWIHSRISKADIRGLRGSNIQRMVFSLSYMLTIHSSELSPLFTDWGTRCGYFHSLRTASLTQHVCLEPLLNADWIEPGTFRFVAQHLSHCETETCSEHIRQ